MYSSGDLRALDLPCDSAVSEGEGAHVYCDDKTHKHSVGDARGDAVRSGRIAYLPHSCEKWVIGDAEQVRLLIQDLQELLASWENV